MEGIWVQLLGAIATVLGAVLTYATTKLINYLIKKMDATEQQKQAFDLLAAGMAEAQNEFIREAKKASEDGRLTKEEIKAAEQMALERAKDLAKGPVKDIIISWGKDQVSSYIKQILNKEKK